MDILQYVNKKMGHPITKTEDPNETEKPKEEKTLLGAAIPVALTGLYFQGSSIHEAEKLVGFMGGQGGADSDRLLDILFKDKKGAIVDAVAEYAHTDASSARSALEQAALAGLESVRENTQHSSPKEIARYLVSQKHLILKQLPPHIQLGRIIGDDALDDAVNKMTGPVSSFMNKLGDAMSDPEK